MMTKELYSKIEELFSSNIQGGVSEDFMGMIDRWIEDGEITQEEWNTHELEICGLFDDNWFTCECCGWTVPIHQQTSNGYCNDCDED